MASPKNWERMRSVENGKIEYAWENDEAESYPGEDVSVYVTYIPSKSIYWANLERGNGEDVSIGSHTSKREARKDAVKWMREHPMARIR